MTHASLAVIPESIFSEFDWHKMFPGFSLENLMVSADLRNSNAPANRLYTGQFKPIFSTEHYWPCFIDVPDFNTTSLTNWEKAEQMLKRSDTVIFTVYHEAYKSQKTFEMLKKALLFSGSLIYLLTKLDANEAEISAKAIREDLINAIEKDPDFRQTRSDGTTIADFFKNSAFMFSPYESSPCLDSIRSVSGCYSTMTEHLKGCQGLEVILRQQLQAIAKGVDASEILAEKSSQIRQKNAELINQTLQQLQESACSITGEEFPVFHILAIIRRVLEQNRPMLLQRAFKPFVMLGSGLKHLINGAKTALSHLTGKDLAGGLHLRNDLEKKRLQAEVETLIDKWHTKSSIRFPDIASARSIAEKFLSIELPPVDSDWETSVTESIQEWQKGNKNIWLWLNVVNDIFIILGSGLVIADLFLDGGMGTLGIVAAIGGSSATGGFLLSLFNNMGLGSQVVQAHRDWKKMRQKEYLNHLEQHFAGPLFLDHLKAIELQLNDSNLENFSESCRKLKEMIRQHE